MGDVYVVICDEYDVDYVCFVVGGVFEFSVDGGVYLCVYLLWVGERYL